MTVGCAPTATASSPRLAAPLEQGFRWHNTDWGETCHGPEWFVEAVQAGRIQLRGGPNGVDWTAAHVWTEAGEVVCTPGDWIFVDINNGLLVISRDVMRRVRAGEDPA